MTPNWTIDTKYRTTYAPAEEPATTGLIAALEEIGDEDPVDWPPLEDAIPSTELNQLLAEGDDVTVTFSYVRLQITIHDDGVIVVRSPDAATTPGDPGDY